MPELEWIAADASQSSLVGSVRAVVQVNGHQCKKPDIAVLDYVAGWEPDRHPMVNRLCMTCMTHWFGNAGVAVFEMPRAVWDGWINTMFVE